MYFKCISFSFQRACGRKESRVKALESFTRVCNKLILSISNSNFIKLKRQWDCNDSRATPSNSFGGLEMAQHPTAPSSHFSLPLKIVSAISVRNAFRNPELLSYTAAQVLFVWLLFAHWKLVGLSPADQGTGMGQCCQGSFQHEPHPKGSTCISCPHHAHAALHLLKKKKIF